MLLFWTIQLSSMQLLTALMFFLRFSVARFEEKDAENKKECARLHERYTDVSISVHGLCCCRDLVQITFQCLQLLSYCAFICFLFP
jgi:hypothetical protein